MHNGFYTSENLDGNTKIWRYLKYDHFEYLLKESKLWCSQVDKFDDEFEGWYPETDEHRHALFKKLKKQTYANCWHKKNHESFLMWKVYGNDENNEGIAIQSTLQRLQESLKKEPTLEQYIKKVKYVDLNTYQIDNNFLAPFFLKSNEYDDEREIRVLTQIMDPNKWSSYKDVKILVPVQLDELIENIHVSPHASEDTYNSVQSIVDKYGLNIAVKPPKKKPTEKKSNDELRIEMIENSGADMSGNYIIKKDCVQAINQNEH